MKRKIVYVDMDGVLVDFDSGLSKIPDDVLTAYRGKEDDIPGIFSLMDALPGAIEAFIVLAERFDTYILSTSPWGNPSAWKDKLLWVKQHLGEHAYKRLILTHHKDLLVGDYLIDDRTRHGADRFGGEHIHFSSERFPDWKAVLQYLLGAGR
jgi:5'(3')-deoxyribonucleotidase